MRTQYRGPANPIIERLNSHRIAKKKQSTVCRAPNRECEHAADMAYAFGTPNCECRKQNFGVRLGTETTTFRLEITLQFTEIVNLTIEGQYLAIVGGFTIGW